MAGYDRQIVSGDPGTRWVNTTDRPRYQFIASLVNTCGACLQYHMQIGPFWGIPLHYGCRCRQAAVPVGARAPHAFVDYRELLDGMAADQQKAAVGASCWRLIESGTVEWKDVVTSARVRSLREVVALKKLSVKAMTDVGVGRVFAERAYESVHTAAHELAAQVRAQAQAAAQAAGMTAQQLADELAKRLGSRIGIRTAPTTPGGEPAVQRFKARGSSAAELAKLLTLPGITLPIVRPKRKPKPRPPEEPPAAAPASVPTPPAPPAPTAAAASYAFETRGDLEEADIAAIRQVIEELPASVRGALQRAGVKFVYVEKLADWDPSRSQQVPRGWNQGETWASADGLFSMQYKAVVVCKTRLDPMTNQMVVSSRQPGVLRHEAGHAFDHHGTATEVSSSPSFLAAYRADAARIPDWLKPSYSYFLQAGHAGPSEAAAELFAQLHGGGAMAARLEAAFPKTAEYLLGLLSQGNP